MLRTYDLAAWGIAPGPIDPYLPPEVKNLSVQGEVYGHPKFEDGTHITTSRIIDTRGKLVKTLSGTRYRLVGDPHPDYAAWCQEQGIDLDPEAPFK